MKALKAKIIELPPQKKARFIEEYGFFPDIADILIDDKNLADWVEMSLSELREWLSSSGESWKNQRIKTSKLLADWLTSELFKFLKRDKIDIKDIKISPENFAQLILFLHQEKINSSSAQKVLEIMYNTGGDPAVIMRDNNLEQSQGDGEDLKEIISEIIKKYPDQFSEYQSGKEALLQFFIGKIMAETSGRFNPQKIIEIIKSL